MALANPEADTIHLVMDNLNIHRRKPLTDVFDAEIGKRRIPNLTTLPKEAKAWNRRVNRDRVKIQWRLNRKAARLKFGYKRKRFTRSKT